MSTVAFSRMITSQNENTFLVLLIAFRDLSCSFTSLFMLFFQPFFCVCCGFSVFCKVSASKCVLDFGITADKSVLNFFIVLISNWSMMKNTKFCNTILTLSKSILAIASLSTIWNFSKAVWQGLLKYGCKETPEEMFEITKSEYRGREEFFAEK